MVALLVALNLASAPGAFPIPGEKGQVVDAHATSIRLPHALRQVERFYREAFRDEARITFVRTHDDHGELLTLRSARAGEGWSKAVLRDDGVSTLVTVTPVIALDAVEVKGAQPPVLAVVIPRSSEVKAQLEQIDRDHDPAH